MEAQIIMNSTLENNEFWKTLPFGILKQVLTMWREIHIQWAWVFNQSQIIPGFQHSDLKESGILKLRRSVKFSFRYQRIWSWTLLKYLRIHFVSCSFENYAYSVHSLWLDFMSHLWTSIFVEIHSCKAVLIQGLMLLKLQYCVNRCVWITGLEVGDLVSKVFVFVSFSLMKSSKEWQIQR